MPQATTHEPLTELVSLDQAADHLGVSRSTIRRRIAAGELPAYRIGRQVRIYAADLRAALTPVPVKADHLADTVTPPRGGRIA